MNIPQALAAVALELVLMLSVCPARPLLPFEASVPHSADFLPVCLDSVDLIDLVDFGTTA